MQRIAQIPDTKRQTRNMSHVMPNLTIKQVSEIPSYTLRFWEKEFEGILIPLGQVRVFRLCLGVLCLKSQIRHPLLRGLHFLSENNYDLVGTAHPTMCYAGVFVGWAVSTKKRINFRKSVNYFCGDMKDATNSNI
ncbi:MAG: hypothetical protein U9R02_02095 [Thermodesulfobacteriota bacterium]|nr:hypothetical protein [Thermodesulfobacteriota bacterium]